MLTAQKTRVRYSPELSLKIGQHASQQRLAYNQAVEHTLAHPNIAKNEIQHQLTLWRAQDPERWSGHVATQRPGLFKGRNAVRQADRASLTTLRECRKEVALREKPAGKGKPPKHPVRPGRDLSPERLYRSRKAPISLTIEDSSTIRRLDRYSISVDGLVIQLSTRIPEKADIRAVQIRERKSSIKRGRNRPLTHRSYNAVLILNVDDPEEKAPWQNPLGLDAGVVHNLTTSDGRHIEQPKTELERPPGQNCPTTGTAETPQAGRTQLDQASKAGPDRKEETHQHQGRLRASHRQETRRRTLLHHRGGPQTLQYAPLRPGNPGKPGQERKGQDRAQPEPGIRQARGHATKTGKTLRKERDMVRESTPRGYLPDLSPLRVQAPGEPQDPSGIPVPELQPAGQRRRRGIGQHPSDWNDRTDAGTGPLGQRPNEGSSRDPPADGNTVVERQPDPHPWTARPKAGPIQGRETGAEGTGAQAQAA